MRRPVLIAGPTASGKSALAARIAAETGGIVVNADALQVFDGWRILTARPSAAEEAALPHRLYGHVAFDGSYSTGDWLRDVAGIVAEFRAGGPRPVIVGGTGLYFRALTEGLAEIPAVPPEVRIEGDALGLEALIAGLDPDTAARIDLRNRARVQRGWEVLRATGMGLARWQDETPPPLLPLNQTEALVLMPEVDWLNRRIAQRFDQMLDQGALTEARAMWPGWNPAHLSSRAIGATELIAHLEGRLSLPDARESAVTQTRQYAKRQRTWFRARMGGWTPLIP